MVDFTTVIYLRNEESLERTLNTLKDQKESIQVLLYDATGAACSVEKYEAECHGMDISVTKADHLSLADAFNNGKEQSAGRYICFVDDDAAFDAGSFTAVMNGFRKNGTIKSVSLKPVYVSPQDGEQQYTVSPGNSGIYSVMEKPEMFQFQIKAFFFPVSEAREIQFENHLGTECCNKYLLDYFMLHGTYYYAAEKSVRYHKAAECNVSNFSEQFDSNWYFNNVELFLLPYSEKAKALSGTQRVWMQMSVYYLLAVRFNNNFQSRNKEVLDKETACLFFSLAGKVLANIDDDIIMMAKKFPASEMDRVLRLFLMRLKFKTLGLPYRIAEQDGFFCFDHGDGHREELLKADNEKIKIHTMHFENGCLEIDFRTTADTIFDKSNIMIQAACDGKQLEIRELSDYPLIKCFGVTVLRRFGGHVSVPVDAEKRIQKVLFSFRWNGKDYPLGIKGDQHASKINKKGSYWCFRKGQIVYPEAKALVLRRVSFYEWLRKELAFSRDYIKRCKDKKQGRIRILHRWSMILSKKTCRKRIWVTFDKLYKAGDNGEYMYHYLRNNVKDIEVYYVIKKDSADYERLKNEKGSRILIHNTWKCQLIMARAEVMLATHPRPWTYCGFEMEDIDACRDLLNARIACLQHGLTTVNIAQYQCRIYDDLGLYFCSAFCEEENVRRPIFGYDDRHIRLTGLARFDGLHSDDQKQILISPTWRRNIVNQGKAYNMKKYNENFKDTEYYRVFNSLINDERLIACARKNHYRIIFMLHPAMSSQIDDYDRNDYVEIIQATGSMNYEKMLTESSMMITDYSGIQFDFAYMNKPIVYYHPQSLPPQYENGVFDYETMGFGPIECEHEKLVDTVCAYLDNACIMTEEYLKRAEDFFAYHDYNNCRRIYEATDRWIKSFK